MGTAQHAYARMLKEEVAPALRGLGMKGSGKHYALPDVSEFRLISFQANKWSTAEELTFTVNLSVIDRALAEQELGRGAKPTATGIYWFEHRHERLGLLLADPQDRWWPVLSDAPTSTVAADVVRAIADHGLPWLRAAIEPTPRGEGWAGSA